MNRDQRREWLAHCSRIAGLALLGAAMPSWAATPPKPAVILVLGDSLSAEYGLARGSGWVALLDKQLARERIAARVVNASISGDTTSGGRSRLPALLALHKPSIVIIELGGNDALRGLPLKSTQDNLSAMTRAAKAAGARVLIAGMQVPPNYGRKYNEDFAAVFAHVTEAEDTALVPFLLKGVADGADSESMFQPDRIHPKAIAHPIMLSVGIHVHLWRLHEGEVQVLLHVGNHFFEPRLQRTLVGVEQRDVRLADLRNQIVDRAGLVTGAIGPLYKPHAVDGREAGAPLLALQARRIVQQVDVEAGIIQRPHRGDRLLQHRFGLVERRNQHRDWRQRQFGKHDRPGGGLPPRRLHHTREISDAMDNEEDFSAEQEQPQDPIRDRLAR